MKEWGFAIVKQDGSIYVDPKWSPANGKYSTGVRALRAFDVLVKNTEERLRWFDRGIFDDTGYLEDAEKLLEEVREYKIKAVMLKE